MTAFSIKQLTERDHLMDRINWNEAWKERNRNFGHDHDTEYWDDLAHRFRKHRKLRSQEPYVEQFYQLSGFEPGESIFDMGCGSGTLAIPFAQKGHEVYAADFSRMMLQYLMEEARESGVEERIHPVLLDWNEDWSLRNDLPKCDVAICSRALIVEDLTLGLKKLESVAADRCCIATWDKPTTHYDRGSAEAIGYDRPGYGSYVYVMGELIDRDMHPELSYIRYISERTGYESIEVLKKGIRESFQYGLTEEQALLLDKYLDDHIVMTEKKGITYYQLKGSEMATIAHIKWKP